MLRAKLGGELTKNLEGEPPGEPLSRQIAALLGVVRRETVPRRLKNIRSTRCFVLHEENPPIGEPHAGDPPVEQVLFIDQSSPAVSQQENSFP